MSRSRSTASIAAKISATSTGCRPTTHVLALRHGKKTTAPGVGIRYGSGGATPYGGGYTAALKGKKPGRVPIWNHPYFRIAVVVVGLLFLIFLFLILTGCVQPAGDTAAGTVTASATPEPGTPAATVTVTSATPAETRMGIPASRTMVPITRLGSRKISSRTTSTPR
ncbi:MAG: hypothetical protein ABSG28_05550 [Methanoregula sp.]